MAVVAGEWPESRRNSDLGHGGRSGWHVRVALVAARLLELGGAQKRACGHVCEEARGGRGLRPRRERDRGEAKIGAAPGGPRVGSLNRDKKLGGPGGAPRGGGG